MWLKNKYRDYIKLTVCTTRATKKSRDKLKECIPGSNSTRSMPEDAPKFAIKSEYRSDPPSPPDLELNSSLSEHESSSPAEL